MPDAKKEHPARRPGCPALTKHKNFLCYPPPPVFCCGAPFPPLPLPGGVQDLCAPLAQSRGRPRSVGLFPAMGQLRASPPFSPPGSGGMRRDRIRPASSAGKTPGVFRCGLGPLAPPADQLDVKHGRRFARAPARSRGRITQIFANGFEADLWGVGGHEVKQS